MRVCAAMGHGAARCLPSAGAGAGAGAGEEPAASLVPGLVTLTAAVHMLRLCTAVPRRTMSAAFNLAFCDESYEIQ